MGEMLSRRAVLGGVAALVACGAPDPSGLPVIAAHGGGRAPVSLYARAARLAGGRGGLALVAPYAARNNDDALGYARWLFSEVGLRRPQVLPLDASAPGLISEASFILFSGGLQSRQMRALASVPDVIPALQAAAESGTVMAGGSAGAAVMSRVMISGGRGGTAHTRAGLGFLEDVVLDQHVIARSREWRIRQVLGRDASLIGVGIDEGTGVLFEGAQMRVYGDSEVILTRAENGALVEERLRRGDRYVLPPPA